MSTTLEIAFLFLILAVLIGLIIWVNKTEKRLKKFFAGKKAKDLEDTILNLQEELVKQQLASEKILKEIYIIKEQMKKSIRGVEITRFNPFPDQGSNKSFAIGLLNEEGDGLVLSSLYSRERMSVFAKPVKKGKSEYELTAEEKSTLEKAKVTD